MSERLIIKFSADAFDKEVERSGLHDCKKYTRHIDRMNKEVEVLDRYDEFASLSLASSDYAQVDNEYGIGKAKYHNGDERLLSHQTVATHAFLKELRGFGLLADVVGSGKTYEACAVLSELSAKGKITTALIVVPSQVYNTWIGVLEMQFGLGRGVLTTVGDRLDGGLFVRGEDGMRRPTRPLIVKTEDFVKWPEADLADALFDVVVIDEAHNLCGEEGESAKAMKLLSIMMMTKKRAKKTYCVLLSATPHSGNLDRMFRLWYFIRCKGGVPEDFDEKEDAERTPEYRKEKAYYKSHICRGADTVMEFINNVKMSEVLENHRDPFERYLQGRHITDFSSLLEGEKKKALNEFLEHNPDIAEQVENSIARAYHNGVLRSIMIRQPNRRMRKGKRIENIFFFPSEGEMRGQITVRGLDRDSIRVNTYCLNSENAIVTGDGSTCSVESYVTKYKGLRSVREAYADLFFEEGVLKAMGLQESAFDKKNSLFFYRNAMKMGAQGSADEDVAIRFSPIGEGGILESKLEVLKEILCKHTGRVILFFDYDIKKSERCYEQVLDALYGDERFASRVLLGDKSDKAKTETAFNEKEDTILVVTDNAFTEGANLQKSNVIVNFQVTPNPLAMEQRIGRIFRLGQENDVTIYSLADMRRLEGYALMYFNCIGLMTSNSGDAAIIAGSNNDNMVTIRCDACGKVKLMSREEYDEYRKNNSDEIYCADFDRCRQFDPHRGMRMTEINSNEVICSSCGNAIKRSNTGGGGQYYCLSGGGVLCSTGARGDRTLYCRKICVLAHCDRFTSGALKGKCEALNAYGQNPNVSEADLEELCSRCAAKSLCQPQCRLTSGLYANAIDACRSCHESSCSPKPHVLAFDKKWSAVCPICAAKGESGRLRPVVARTFETFIRSSFDYLQDGGVSFCNNLLKESKRVSQIRQILANDDKDRT